MAGATRDLGKERFWQRMVRLWRRSRLSVRAFCAEHQLSEPSFYGWRRTFADREHVKQATADPTFVPVQVVPPMSSPLLELALGRDRVVRVPAGFDPATLRQLLAVLEEHSC